MTPNNSDMKNSLAELEHMKRGFFGLSFETILNIFLYALIAIIKHLPLEDNSD